MSPGIKTASLLQLHMTGFLGLRYFNSIMRLPHFFEHLLGPNRAPLSRFYCIFAYGFKKSLRYTHIYKGDSYVVKSFNLLSISSILYFVEILSCRMSGCSKQLPFHGNPWLPPEMDTGICELPATRKLREQGRKVLDVDVIRGIVLPNTILCYT